MKSVSVVLQAVQDTTTVGCTLFKYHKMNMYKENKEAGVYNLMHDQTWAARCETSVLSVSSILWHLYTSEDSEVGTQADNRDGLSLWSSPHLAFYSHPINAPLYTRRLGWNIFHQAFIKTPYSCWHYVAYLVGEVQAVPQWQVLLDGNRVIDSPLTRRQHFRKRLSWNTSWQTHFITLIEANCNYSV